MGIIPDENSQVYIIQRKVLEQKKVRPYLFFLTAKSIGKQKVSPTLPFFLGAPPFRLFFHRKGGTCHGGRSTVFLPFEGPHLRRPMITSPKARFGGDEKACV